MSETATEVSNAAPDMSNTTAIVSDNSASGVGGTADLAGTVAIVSDTAPDVSNCCRDDVRPRAD